MNDCYLNRQVLSARQSLSIPMARSPAVRTLRQLREEVLQLRARVEALSHEVRGRGQAGADEGPPGVIVFEQMSKDEVRSRVLDIVAEKETTDIAELHQTIRCDIRVLIEILDELREQGRLVEG